jgi:hypothetical protein
VWSNFDGNRTDTLPAGDYQLEFRVSGSLMGAYSFKFFDSPAPQVFAYTVGSTVSDGVPAAGAGNLETVASVDRYTFTVPSGGETLTFQMLGAAMRSWLTNTTTGAAVWSNFDGNRTDTLPAGDYQLEFRVSGSLMGAYSFKFTQVGGTVVPSVRGVSQAVSGQSAVELSLSRPAGTQAGDLLVAAVAVNPSTVAGLQAENGSLTGEGTGSGFGVDASQTGWTGTGSLGKWDANGQSVTVTYDAVAAGTYTLGFRYARGGTGSSSRKITVNTAQVAANKTFTNTGGWSTWSMLNQTVTLAAGTNTIRIELATASGNSGPLNLDRIDVTPPASTSVNTPAGWTLQASGTSGLVRELVYTRVDDGDDVGPWKWTFSGASAQAAGAITAWQSAAGIEAVSAAQANTAATAYASPAITTLGANRMVVAVHAAAADTDIVPAGALTQVAEARGTGDNTVTVTVSSQPQSTAGAVGTLTATGANATSVGTTLAITPTT